jgi:hypothetical protein
VAYSAGIVAFAALLALGVVPVRVARAAQVPNANFVTTATTASSTTAGGLTGHVLTRQRRRW